MSESVVKMKEHLAALDAFMGSAAFSGHQDAIKEELRMNETAQIANVPDSLPNLVQLIMLKGEHQCLTESLARFEDARVRLSDRIDAIVEAELQNATETKK